MILYLSIFALGGLIYFFLLSKEAKKTLNIFFFLGSVAMVSMFVIGVVFNHATSVAEISIYLAAVVLTVQCWREISKL